MTILRFRLLPLLIFVFALLVPVARAQIYIGVDLTPPPSGTSGTVTATCEVALDDASSWGYDDYFYSGVWVSSCTLYTPDNGDTSCTGTSGGEGVGDSSCTIKIDSSSSSGNYNIQAEGTVYNWYDYLALGTGSEGWNEECVSDNPDYPYDDPLGYGFAGGKSYPNALTGGPYIGDGLEWDCNSSNGFADIIEIESPDVPYTAPISVTISPTSATLVQGDNEEFTANVTNGNDSQVSWSLSGPGSLSSSTGQSVIYYAPDLYSASSATIRATSTQDSTKSATADITLQVSNPEITSAPTASLPVGQSSIITIYGQYLGTTPPNITDNVAGVIIGSIGAPTGASDGEVQSVSFVVTVPNCIPANSVTFQIYFTDGAQNPYAPPITVGIQNQTPTPQIMISPTNLALCQGGPLAPNGANETDVFAGQQVQLCVAPPPTGCSITSQGWSFENNADIVGGFMNTAQTGPPSGSGGGGPVPAILNQSNSTFYFINPGGFETATYKWILSDGNANGTSTTADFNILGPTGITLTTGIGYVGFFTGTLANGTQVTRLQLRGLSVCGNARSTNGVSFEVNESGAALPPSGYSGKWGNIGSYSWVQLLLDSNTIEIVPSGTETCRTYTAAAAPVLDNTYPYGAPPFQGALCSQNSPNDTATDGPGVLIPAYPQTSPLGGRRRYFSARMYLMWTPPAGSNCSSENACTVPVPLGSIDWSMCGGAINTLNPNGANGGWSLTCANPAQGSSSPTLNFNSNVGYPKWTAASSNSAYNCTNP